MKKVLVIITILAISFITLKPAWVQDQSRHLKGMEFITGYSQTQLKEKKDYRFIPLLVDFDFDIKPLTKRIGFNFPSLAQFQIEPFLSLVTSPETNMEIGISFFLKFGLLPEGWKIQPYIKGGSGMIYMTQHTLEQSTQFNFISQFGVGFHCFFNKDRALTLEYRFRHLSNASIKHPNNGIDSHYYLLGITQHF